MKSTKNIYNGRKVDVVHVYDIVYLWAFYWLVIQLVISVLVGRCCCCCCCFRTSSSFNTLPMCTIHQVYAGYIETLVLVILWSYKYIYTERTTTVKRLHNTCKHSPDDRAVAAFVCHDTSVTAVFSSISAILTRTPAQFVV